jgi:hypothetical protein
MSDKAQAFEERPMPVAPEPDGSFDHQNQLVEIGMPEMNKVEIKEALMQRPYYLGKEKTYMPDCKEYPAIQEELNQESYPALSKVLAGEDEGSEGAEEAKVDALASEVDSYFYKLKPQIQKEALAICKRVGLDPEEFTRRSYDGVKQNKWLVELMLGDLLTDGKIKY